MAKTIEKHPERLEQYCKDQAPFGLGLVEPRILVRKVKMKSLISINGYPMHINGRGSGGTKLICDSAVSLVLSEEEEKYLKNILKFSEGKCSDENISLEMNNVLYDTFLMKHSDTIYQKRPANQTQVLIKGKSIFKKLTLEEQVSVLKNILNLFKCKNLAADLTLIGGSKNAGTTSVSNKISNCESALLIHQSPTGLTSQTIDLLKL